MSNTAEIWKPHATVAAICEKDGRFLLVKENIQGQKVLNQPAGHLDPGESLEQAVIRETLEETSYLFTPTGLCGIYRFVPESGPEAHSNRTYLRFSFAGIVGECLNLPLDDGIISAVWMTLDEIKQSQSQHRSPMVLQCVLDYLEKPTYPLQLFSPDFL